MEVENDSAHVQAKFFTHQKKYSLTDVPFSIPADIDQSGLNSLINSLLNDKGLSESFIKFDFLINNEFLLTSLEDHVKDKSLSTESVLEIEYIERHPAPEPCDSLEHDDWISSVKANGDFILSGSYDNTVKIWNTEGDLLITVPAHEAPVKSISWVNLDEEPLKNFLSGSHDSTIMIWQWNQFKNSIECAQVCKGHAGSVDCIAVNPSKTKFCSGSWDKMLKIWDANLIHDDPSLNEDLVERPMKKKKTENKIPTRVPLLTLSGHNEGISSAFWLSENEICSASWDHTIRVWDVEKAAEKLSLNGTKVFLDTSYSHLSKLIVAASSDRHVRLYDPRVSDGSIVKCTFTSHNAWVSAVAWSPINEHHFISGGYDFLMKLWDTRSPKAPLYDMTGHEDRILAVDWSIPQHMISGGADCHLKLYKCPEKYIYS